MTQCKFSLIRSPLTYTCSMTVRFGNNSRLERTQHFFLAKLEKNVFCGPDFEKKTSLTPTLSGRDIDNNILLTLLVLPLSQEFLWPYMLWEVHWEYIMFCYIWIYFDYRLRVRKRGSYGRRPSVNFFSQPPH